VREYESRLRIAGEKIKTEKQGGKERALQLENQVRCVFLPSSFSSSMTLPLLRTGQRIPFRLFAELTHDLDDCLYTRDLERQVDSAKRRNTKAEGIVATASHLMPSD